MARLRPKLLLLTLLALVAPGSSAAARKMNVLFFAVDDLRYQLGTSGPGDLGPGCPLVEGPGCKQMITPAIDALAARSLFLEKNYVQQAICAVSRTSILTGRRPDGTQVWDLHTYWRDLGHNYTTIPEFFKNRGFLSVGMGKIFHPGPSSGTGSTAANATLARNSSACPPNRCGPCSDDQLFSWSRPFWHSPNQEGSPKGGFGDPGGKAWAAVGAEAATELADAQIARNAVATLEQFKADGVGSPDGQPFFLAVGFHRPHLPFIVPQDKLDLYPLESIQLPTNQQPPRGMPAIAWSNSGELVAYADVHGLRNGTAFSPGETLPAAAVRNLRRGYYAAVSHMDDQVGAVMSALDQSGFADNTIVSFWGDHGWQLGEHGEWCKHTNFELATRAPMMIRVPGLTDSGIRTNAFTEHIDLFPTLTELAMGYTLPRCPAGPAQLSTALCTMGKSLVPLMHGGAAPANSSYMQYPRDAQMMTRSTCLDGPCVMGYSVVTRLGGAGLASATEYRYTEWVAFNTKRFRAPDFAASVGAELYDHTGDPGENLNLCGSGAVCATPSTVPPAVLEDLRRILRRGPLTGGGWGPWDTTAGEI